MLGAVPTLAKSAPTAGGKPPGEVAVIYGEHRLTYERDAAGNLRARPDSARHSAKDDVVDWLRDLVVPRNYPDSVSRDYLPTRRWLIGHDFVNSIAGTFAGISVAAALGVSPVWGGAGMVAFNYIRDTVTQLIGASFAKTAPMAGRKPRAWMLGSEFLERVGTVMDTAAGLLPASAPALLPALTTTSALIRAFGGSMKGASMADIGPRQARDENLGEVGMKNSAQGVIANVSGAGLALLLHHLCPHTLGRPLGAAIVATLASAAALYAQGRFIRNLNYQPVNEKVVRDTVAANVPAPDARPWRQVTTMFQKDHFKLGRDMRPLLSDSARFDQLQTMYADRNHMLEMVDGKPYVILRGGTRPTDGSRVTITPEDRLLAEVQAAMAERLANGEDYRKRAAAGGGRTAADRWVVEESLTLTPKDPKPLTNALNAAGWSADALRFQDVGWRGQW